MSRACLLKKTKEKAHTSDENTKGFFKLHSRLWKLIDVPLKLSDKAYYLAVNKVKLNQ